MEPSAPGGLASASSHSSGTLAASRARNLGQGGLKQARGRCFVGADHKRSCFPPRGSQLAPPAKVLTAVRARQEAPQRLGGQGSGLLGSEVALLLAVVTAGRTRWVAAPRVPGERLSPSAAAGGSGDHQQPLLGGAPLGLDAPRLLDLTSK